MVVDGNKIKVNTSVTPNVGVSIADVQTVIKDYSTDLGTLCTSNKVNMWARYKPLRVEKLGILTQEDMEDVHYGIHRIVNVPLLNPTTLKLNNNPWLYDKPMGSESNPATPYRLTDFKNYYHNAPAPIKIQFNSDEIPINNAQSLNNNINFTLKFENDITGWFSDNCLYMADIFEGTSSWNHYYITVGLIHYREGNQYACYFQSVEYDLQHYFDTPGSYAVNVLVNLADFRTKMASYISDGTKWQAIMFLSNELCNGKTDTPSSTLFLQYDSATPVADSEGYQNGCDRHIMTVRSVDWSTSLTKMTLSTTFKKDGNQYKIQEVTIAVERGSGIGGFSTGLSFSAITNASNGVLYNGTRSQQRTFQANSVTTFAFADGETTKSITLNASEFSSLRYDFNLSGDTVKVAILNCHLIINNSDASLGTETHVNEWGTDTERTITSIRTYFN